MSEARDIPPALDLPPADGIRFPLALRLAPAAVLAPAAWFIPGGSAAAWIDELAGWGVLMSELRLYVVPASVRDHRPIGVLVVAPTGQLPRASARAQPYGLLAGRLYVPADAVLDPPVSDTELRAGLVWPVQVLHPAAGLVGFGDKDALAVGDLLAAPTQRDAQWDRAAAGVSAPPRLISVEPEEVPSIEDVLGGGRDDIGSEQPGELPRAPDESPVKDALSRAGRPGLRAMRWLSSLGGAAASQAGGSGWMGRVGRWADRTLARITKDLEDRRFRELQRLQKLLESDPDEGLRYAIPLRQNTGPRGVAPPAASLPPRRTDFNLASLGGGRPADAWGVPWDLQQQLTARYREAANREMNLGRYRRAAYIFAELLGDLPAAANALEQGRQYREAAALYRDHLRNPAKAAGCLERGGLLLEAVAVYTETGSYEKAGDLYTTIEQPEDAAHCYRLAVKRLAQVGSRTDASRLLETKLGAPDEALDLLTVAWPAEDRGGTCLQESFALLGRLGRHDEAARRIKRLRDDPLPPDRTVPLATVLANIVTGYPNPAARTLAADAARVVVGRRLPAASEADKQQLVQAVARLAPEDRLLTRDGNRYLTRRKPRPPRPAASGAGKGAALRNPVVVHQFHMPDIAAGWTVASRGSDFVAMGTGPLGTVFVRGRWDGCLQRVIWPRDPPPAGSLLEPVPGASRVIIVPWDGSGGAPQGAFRRGMLMMPPNEVFTDGLELSCASWVPQDGVVSMCFDDNGLGWVLRLDESMRASLAAHRATTGELLLTHHIPLPLEQEGTVHLPPRIVARKGQAYIAWGAAVVRVNPAGQASAETMPASVRALAASAPFTRVRVAAAMEWGGRVFREDAEAQPFGEGLPDPHVAFTRGGLLVALTPDEGRVYRTNDGRVVHHATFAGGKAPLLAVVPTAKVNEFATFTAGGVVRVYQAPG